MLNENSYLLGLVAVGILENADLPHPSDNDRDYQEFVKNGNCEDKDYETYLSLCDELGKWVSQMDHPDFGGPNSWHYDVKKRWNRISNEVSFLEWQLGY